MKTAAIDIEKWKIEAERIEHVLKHDVNNTTCCETWKTQSILELISRPARESSNTRLNEYLIEFIMKTVRTDNSSSNQNLIVGEFKAIES